MNILDLWGVHTLTVYQMTSGPYGPVKGEPVTITGCWVVEETRLVRDRTGATVTSTAQAACPVGTVIDLDSQPVVVLPSGRETTIISVSTVDPHGLPLPEYVQLNLE